MNLHIHPFGLSPEPDYIAKLKRDRAELAATSVIILLLSCIGVVIALAAFAVKSNWSLL